MTASILDPFYSWAEQIPTQRLFAFLNRRGKMRESLTYAAFLQRTTDVANHLRQAHPFVAGTRVLLAYPPGVEVITAFFAAVRLGWVPVPVYPAAGSGARFVQGLRNMDAIANDCGASAVLTRQAYHWSLRARLLRQRVRDTIGMGRLQVERLPWIHTDDAAHGTRASFADTPNTLLFLQYTSGSTGDPKGVMVSHANILANCEAVVDHKPVGVSWLPQYHDMGLIGYYIFFALRGGTTYGFSPLDFLERPTLWLETISTYGGTASSAPNFAFAYCLSPDKVPTSRLAGLDLSSLRFLMAAAEPVRADVLRAFANRFRPYGLRANALFAAYGLAEHTLAVSNYGRRGQRFAARPLQAGRVVALADADNGAPAVELNSCGVVLGATELAIATADHLTAAPDEVGEIWLRGPSRCLGYWQRPDLSTTTFDAELRHRDHERGSSRGWLRTGDLGFVYAGELYVCGRLKDLIILRGANHYPQDIETVVEQVAGVRRGCVAAFAAGGTKDEAEMLVVAAEIQQPIAGNLESTATAIAHASLQRLGLAPGVVLLLPPRSIPKTSSGKIARRRTREQWHAGALPLLANVSGPLLAPPVADHAISADPWQALAMRFALNTEDSGTLADAGLDSLGLADFGHTLKEQLVEHGYTDLAGAVDLALLQQIAVADLFQALGDLASSGAAGRHTLKGILAQVGEDLQIRVRRAMVRDANVDKKRFCNGITPRPINQHTSSTANAVLLTGGTGFFGPFLLNALLQQTRSTVHVLVRGTDDHDAEQRLSHSLAASGMAIEALDRTRIRVLRGDLAESRFGLSPSRWQALVDDVGEIVHNGATVNYLADYDTCRPATVEGTYTALELVQSGCPKVLNHISTTFVFGWSVEETLRECDQNRTMAHLDFGYSQSKWVAEQIVLRAIEEGIAARVFRPALLSPAAGGYGSSLDIALRLLAFMVNHGVGTSAGNQVSFTPADVAADNIVAIARLDASLGSTLHVTRDAFASMANVTDLIGEMAGIDFTLFPLSEFVPEVVARCRRSDPLFPLLEFLVRSADKIAAMEFKRYDNGSYRRFRAVAPHARPDPPLRDVVAALLALLRRKGVIDV